MTNLPTANAPDYKLPASLSAEELRVLRDRALRAKEEVQKILKKCPDLFQNFWAFSYRNTAHMDIGDALLVLIKLSSMFDAEWLAKRPKKQERVGLGPRTKRKHKIDSAVESPPIGCAIVHVEQPIRKEYEPPLDIKFLITKTNIEQDQD